jgi:integrase
MGCIYRRGGKYWVKWYRNGVPMRESADTDKESVARTLLRTREGDVERGVPVTPQTNRALFDELADDVLTDYRINAKRSLKNVERSFTKHLRPYFEGRKAAGISTDQVRKYIAHRQGQGAKNATINRELSAMKRAFSLGIEAGKVTQKPKMSMLRENNVRTGFFEPAQFHAVCNALPAHLRPVVEFAYLTGWRTQAEVLPLQWRQVDFAAGTVSLDVGSTKNGEGRVFPMTAELRALLEAQRAHTDAVQRRQGSIIPHVFHRNGARVGYPQKAWWKACKAAGCPGRILHDFRRTAVRNLVRAGIPERVAMQMTGHKTRSVFERYNIVSEGDLADAVRRLDAAGKKLTGTITGTISIDRPEAAVAPSRN